VKPIQLTIAGLQSYREKQDIDFTRLCDAGVFGIFGPTGSGKSTILDAMTLALYGEVERASGGTQGILNHAENTLSVSFTFELSSSSGWERYRVDRQYKRSGETSLLQTVSRFVRLGGGAAESGIGELFDPAGAVVLADKSKEVTKAVQDTLGLSMHDFTRAVVLPQGKFAEFLSLKDSDRRQMLQRLFSLEAYGNQLNARLSSRMKAADMGLKQIVAEQQGLGDASAEALQAAAARLHEAKSAAKLQRERLQASQARRDALKQRWDWQQEREQLERELAKLASREEAVALWERSLVLADAAERLLPFLRER
jgi:DNA repair protein SbcC/Rad50